jgi:hypothetical protein
VGWVGHVAFNRKLRKSYKILVQKIKMKAPENKFVDGTLILELKFQK